MIHCRVLARYCLPVLTATLLALGGVSAYAAKAASVHRVHAPASVQSQSAPVFKLAIDHGIALDDAAESMRLRANAMNLKLVAELPLSSQVQAITGTAQRRITIFQFCDALTAKDLIDLNMDFAVYMPCRIALIEDAKGQGWLVMTDIDVDAVAREKHVPPELKQRIEKVRTMLIEIMKAGAHGDI
jgi:uncharacterized protein (DUF302 family)